MASLPARSVSAKHAEPFLPGRRAEDRHHGLVNAPCRQRHEDEATVIGTLGDEGRMLEDAAEAGDEILAGAHATSPG